MSQASIVAAFAGHHSQTVRHPRCLCALGKCGAQAHTAWRPPFASMSPKQADNLLWPWQMSSSLRSHSFCRGNLTERSGQQRFP